MTAIRKCGGDAAHPELHKGFVKDPGGLLEFLQSGPGDQRKNAHLQAIKHPAKESRDQGHRSGAGRRV
jgi:hypothetical protein